MGRKMMSMSSPLMEISIDGDTMTIKNSSLLRTVEHKFKLGEEYEEKMPNSIIKVSASFKILNQLYYFFLQYFINIISTKSPAKQHISECHNNHQ